MRYRRLDANGDYSFGFGNKNFVTDLEATTQAIKTKLNMFKGEWWENLLDGLPFFQDIAGKRGTQANLDAIDLVFRSRILETPGVNDIASYQSQYDSAARKYTATATIDTIYGTVEVTIP